MSEGLPCQRLRNADETHEHGPPSAVVRWSEPWIDRNGRSQFSAQVLAVSAHATVTIPAATCPSDAGPSVRGSAPDPEEVGGWRSSIVIVIVIVIAIVVIDEKDKVEAHRT